MKPIRVLVAEDEPQVREVLAAVIGTDEDLELIGSAEEVEGAIAIAAVERPDVALVDVRMPGGGGIRAAKEIVRRSPPTRVIALSAFEDAETILSMLRAGARFYVAKSDPTADILAAIHRAVEDGDEPENEIERIVRAFDDWKDRRKDRPEIDELRRARVTEALQPDGTGVRFQPIVDLVTGEVVGEEASPVVHGSPERSSSALLADAQEVGMLASLETALTRSALEELDQLLPGRWVSVRVSLQTLRSPELVDALNEAPPGRLVLQFSELDPADDRAGLATELLLWRSRGIRVALDDVGPGIESIRELVNLRPDLAKLDPTLVRGIDGDLARQRLVRALVLVAADLGCEVIAKGVDTTAATETLIRLGVAWGQGAALGMLEPSTPGGGPTKEEDR
jgi:EAL domain-containing protein (putative c-di-GMP-specific phosphodiesterase class I)/DNA-binding NarL/FixJ family response regulator